MKCIECGHELKDGAVFCIRCGAMQVSKDGTAKQPGSTVKPATAGAGSNARHTAGKSFKPTPRRSTASVVVPIVAVIAVLAAVGALAMFVLNPTSSNSGSSSQVSATLTGSSSDSSSASSSSSSASSASSSSSSASASSSSASSSAAASGAAAGANATGASSASASAASAGNTADNANANTQPQTYTEPVQQTYTEPVKDSSYYLGDSSSRYYSRSEVESMSNYDLYYARNEIFARHGRMFQNSDLQAYFNSKSWYTPTYTPSQWASMDSPLSDIERKNSSLMLDVEKKRNSPYV